MNVSSAVRTAVAAWIATMLAGLTIVPIVQGTSWYLGLAFLAALVGATGLLVRRFTASAPVVVAVQVAVWVLAITAIFLPDVASLGLLPGADAVSSGAELFRQGLAVMHRQAAPVEDTAGVVFVTTAGLGLVALVVDVVAVTLRRPAVAGLPLLATYCVPAAVLPDGLDWTLFLFAAAGYLVLVGVDSVDRIQAWGRVLGGPGTRSGSSAAWSIGLDGARGIAAASLAAAIVLPVLVPGIGERALTGSGTGGKGGRNGNVTVINPLLELRKDLADQSNAPIITYRTTQADPQPLRIVVDDVFNGDTWSPSDDRYPKSQSPKEDIGLAPGLESGIPTQPVQTTITVGSLGQTYLPLPYPWRKVDVPGNWYYDRPTLNVVGDGITAKDLRYTVDHYLVQPTVEQLENAGPPPSSLAMDMGLPPELDPTIERTAREVGGKGSSYEKAVRLRNWLRTFDYSTQTPGGSGSDASGASIVAFLNRKYGYCVHFASAMAVMARTLSIPARVAVGFLPGTKNADGTWTIKVSDAHAWPELYFTGIGWVRFEPTPAAHTAGVGDVVGGGPTTGPSDAATPRVSGAVPSASVNPKVAKETQADTGAAGTTAQPVLWRRLITAIPWPWIAAAGVVLLLAMTPAAALVLARRRRWSRAKTRTARAEAALEELTERLSDLGVPVSPSLTPRGLRQWLVGAEYVPGQQSGSLDRLVAEVETARYAPPGGEGLDPAELRADVRDVADLVAAEVPARRRRLARFLPASGVALVTGAARTAETAGGATGRRIAEQVGDEVRKLSGTTRRR